MSQCLPLHAAARWSTATRSLPRLGRLRESAVIIVSLSSKGTALFRGNRKFKKRKDPIQKVKIPYFIVM